MLLAESERESKRLNSLKGAGVGCNGGITAEILYCCPQKLSKNGKRYMEGGLFFFFLLSGCQGPQTRQSFVHTTLLVSPLR